MTREHVWRTSSGGFTLVELLVVLVILAGASAIATPAFLSSPVVSPEGAAAVEVLGLLHAAKRASIERGRPVRITFAPEAGRYWVETHDERRDLLQAGVLEVNPGVSLGPGAPRVSFTFDPLGPAAGGAIEVEGPDTGLTILVDPSTGEANAVRRP